MSANAEEPMYERWNICESLTPDVVCFRCHQYREERFDELYHRHISKRRLSSSAIDAVLKSFVIRFHGESGMGFDQIVTSFVNDRSGDPRPSPIPWQVTYPEPGVLRHYFGANTKAWADQVVLPAVFRSEAAQ